MTQSNTKYSYLPQAQLSYTPEWMTYFRQRVSEELDSTKGDLRRVEEVTNQLEEDTEVTPPADPYFYSISAIDGTIYIRIAPSGDEPDAYQLCVTTISGTRKQILYATANANHSGYFEVVSLEPVYLWCRALNEGEWRTAYSSWVQYSSDDSTQFTNLLTDTITGKTGYIPNFNEIKVTSSWADLYYKDDCIKSYGGTGGYEDMVTGYWDKSVICMGAHGIRIRYYNYGPLTTSPIAYQGFLFMIPDEAMTGVDSDWADKYCYFAGIKHSGPGGYQFLIAKFKGFYGSTPSDYDPYFVQVAISANMVGTYCDANGNGAFEIRVENNTIYVMGGTGYASTVLTATDNTYPYNSTRVGVGAFKFADGWFKDTTSLSIDQVNYTGTSTDNIDPGQIAVERGGTGNYIFTDDEFLQYDLPSLRIISSGYSPTSFAPATHSILSATHGDTTAAAVVRGDIITGQGATPVWARLAKGAAGTLLNMGADEPQWSTRATLFGSGTDNYIPKLVVGATPTFGDSIMSQSGTTISAAGDITLSAALSGENRTLTVQGYKTGTGAGVKSATFKVESDGVFKVTAPAYGLAFISSVNWLNFSGASYSLTFRVGQSIDGETPAGAFISGDEAGLSFKPAYGSGAAGSKIAFTGYQSGGWKSVLEYSNTASATPVHLYLTKSQGYVGIGRATAPTSSLHINDPSSAVTDAVRDLLTIGHNTSNTATTGFGAGILGQLKSSTTADQDAAKIAWSWADATHATRTSKISFSNVTSAGALTERLYIQGAGVYFFNGNNSVTYNSTTGLITFNLLSRINTHQTCFNIDFGNAGTANTALIGMHSRISIGAYGTTVSQTSWSYQASVLTSASDAVGSAIVTKQVGYLAYPYTYTSGSATATIGTYICFEAGDHQRVGTGGVITNYYGLYVNALTNCTNAYAVYAKTGHAIFNDDGGDYDFRVEGDTATNLLVCDAGLDAVRIGTTTAGAIADFLATSIELKQTTKVDHIAEYTSAHNIVFDNNLQTTKTMLFSDDLADTINASVTLELQGDTTKEVTLFLNSTGVANPTIYLGGNSLTYLAQIYMDYSTGKTHLLNALTTNYIWTADIANVRLGVNNASPAATLDVTGSAIISDTVYLGGTTNSAQVAAGGAITYNGTAKRRLSMRPTMIPGKTTTPQKPTPVDRGAASGFSLPLYATDEEIFFNEYIAGRWDGASDITLSVICYLDTAETDGDDFALQLSWANKSTASGTWSDATNDVVVETNCASPRNAQYSIFKVEFTIDWDLPATDVTASDFWAGRLRRIPVAGGGAVEIAGEVVVVAVVITYTVDKVFKAP